MLLIQENLAEFSSRTVEKAINIPLDYLNEHLAEVPKEDTFYVHCAGGYRSVIWASIYEIKRLSQYDKCRKRNAQGLEIQLFH